MKILSCLAFLLPAIILAQSVRTISFPETNMSNLYSNLAFDGDANKYVYISMFNVALIENGTVSKSCNWSFRSMLKMAKFNAKTKQFFALDGAVGATVKNLIYIDFNETTPEPVRIKLGSSKLLDKNGRGNLNIVCLNEENIRISCVGVNSLSIHDVNLKSKVVTTVFKYEAISSKSSIAFKYSEGDFFHFALLDQKSFSGNQRTFILKHVAVNCATKSMEVEREETIELNCTGWYLQSYSDLFTESGSSIVAIVYVRPKGKSTTLGMYVDVDNLDAGNKLFWFEIEDAYKSAATNDNFHMFYHDNKLHLFNDLEFYVENRSEQATLHVSVDEDNDFELEKLDRGAYPYEFIVSKVLEADLPESKTTHVSGNARINKNQITVYDIAEEKNGKMIMVYVYEFEQDK